MFEIAFKALVDNVRLADAVIEKRQGAFRETEDLLQTCVALFLPVLKRQISLARTQKCQSQL
jgi:hypothetical protein